MASPFDYSGKRVVVSGGASGVGAALLEVVAELGATDVTVLDLKPPSGPHSRYLETDLADEASVDAAVAAIDGPLHAIFNNAGVNSSTGLRTTIAVNYLALRRLSEGLLRKIAPNGAIVNTASTAGSQWTARVNEINELLEIADWNEALDWVERHSGLFDDAYFFSKEVVQVWTLRMAAATRASAVRVNSVCPAPIDTPLLADFRRTIGDKLLDWNVAEAAGRLMSPREAAAPLAFLGSDAASYVSGVNLLVDGGFFAALTTGQLDFSGLS